MERYNLVVIGGGSGGLVVAAGGAGLGRPRRARREARAALHAGGRDARPGDGRRLPAVRLRALQGAAARREGRARRARGAARFGDPRRLRPGPAGSRRRDGLGALARRPQIAPNDSVERFTGLGVDVLLGAGRLKSAHEVEVNGTTVWGRHVVVATGSRAVIPRDPRPRRGRLPHERERLRPLRRSRGASLVMGGGPIGLELGQAFARLGSKVTIVSSSAAHLSEGGRRRRGRPREAALRAEGSRSTTAPRATKVAVRDGTKVVTVKPAERREFDVGGGRDPRRHRPPPERRRPRPRGASASRLGRRASSPTRSAGRTSRPSGPSATSRALTSSRTGRATRRASSCGTRSPRSRSRPATSRTRPGSRTRTRRSPTWASRRRTRRRTGIPYRVFRAEFRAQRPRGLRRDAGGQLREGARRPEGEDPRRHDRPPARGRPPRRDRPREEERARRSRRSASVIHAYPSLSEIHGAVARANTSRRR